MDGALVISLSLLAHDPDQHVVVECHIFKVEFFLIAVLVDESSF